MAMINVDFKDENYSNRAEQVPAGLHPARVIGVEIRDSKNRVNDETGKAEKYFEWEFIITSGEAAGQKMVARTTAIKGKRWLLKQALDCCGIPANAGKYNFDLSELSGKCLILKVEVKDESFISKKDGQKKTVQKSSVTRFMKDERAPVI